MTPPPTLDERLRRLEDKDAILDLFQAYRRCLDSRDLVGYSELFTADAEWHGSSMRAGGGPAGILAMLRENFAEGGSSDDWHVVANPIIELDGDEATATSTYLVVFRTADGTPTVRLMGQYNDRLARQTDGRWLFAHREAPALMPPNGLLA